MDKDPASDGFMPFKVSPLKTWFTADQMQAYALEALRAQAASVPVGEVLHDEMFGCKAGQLFEDLPIGTKLYAGAPPAHIPADVDAPEGAKFFSYDEDNGFEMHGTAEEAKNAATVRLVLYRDDANIDNEWADETDSVCWGCVLESAEAMPVLGAPEPSFDYKLTAHPPQPQAVAASSPVTAVDAVDLLQEAHGQIRHLIDDLSVCIDDDGLTRYVPRDAVSLTYSNLIGALIPLAERIRAALQASRQPQAQQAVAEGAGDVSKAVALYEAVSAIYFDDSSDFKPALLSAIRALSPEMEEMLRDDPRAAWQKADEAKDVALATKERS